MNWCTAALSFVKLLLLSMLHTAVKTTTVFCNCIDISVQLTFDVEDFDVYNADDAPDLNIVTTCLCICACVHHVDAFLGLCLTY